MKKIRYIDSLRRSKEDILRYMHMGYPFDFKDHQLEFNQFWGYWGADAREKGYFYFKPVWSRVVFVQVSALLILFGSIGVLLYLFPIPTIVFIVYGIILSFGGFGEV